jgi:hypothetical protein
MGLRCHDLSVFGRISLTPQQSKMQHLTCIYPLVGLQVRHLSRRQRKPPKKRPTKARTRVINKHELAWRHEKSDYLRTTLMRQYEEEERPRWSRGTVRIGQSFNVGSKTPSQESSPNVSISQDSHEPQITPHEDVQCGIFWDIENVHNKYVYDLFVLMCKFPPASNRYRSNP